MYLRQLLKQLKYRGVLEPAKGPDALGHTSDLADILGSSPSIIFRISKITGCGSQLDDVLLWSVFLFLPINSVGRPTC